MLRTIKLSGIFLLLIFSFTACEDESLSEDFELQEPENPENPENPEEPQEDVSVEDIIGTWKLQESFSTVSQSITDPTTGEELVFVLETEYISGDNLLTFNEDNTYINENDITVTVTSIFNGTELDSQNDTVNSTDTGTWELNESVVQATSDVSDTEITYTILSLDNQTLVVSIVTESIQNIEFPEGFPEPQNLTLEGQGTFTKVE